MKNYVNLKDKVIYPTTLSAVKPLKGLITNPDIIRLSKFSLDAKETNSCRYDFFWTSFSKDTEKDGSQNLSYIPAFDNSVSFFSKDEGEYIKLHAVNIEDNQIILRKQLPYELISDQDEGQRIRELNHIKDPVLASDIAILHGLKYNNYKDIQLSLVSLFPKNNPEKFLMTAWYVLSTIDYRYIPLHSIKTYLLAQYGYDNIAYSPIPTDTPFSEDGKTMIMFPPKMLIHTIK